MKVSMANGAQEPAATDAKRRRGRRHSKLAPPDHGSSPAAITVSRMPASRAPGSSWTNPKKYPPTGSTRFARTGSLAYSRRTWLARASPHRRADPAAEARAANRPPDGDRLEDDLMDERDIHGLIADVRAGRLSRRAFTRIMIGLGLVAPLAARMLGAGSVVAQPRADGFTPTRRGGGGQLKVLWWQAPTLLNPHFAVGTKDQDGSRVFYEPLAAFDPEGNLFPILAQEIPTLDNGGVARDGKSVTWKLKRGVSWHDGKPFTADDLVFNWEYAADPATAAVTITTYRDIERVEKLDSHTVKLVFKSPTPFWFDAFCGARGMIVPKHLFQAFKGDKSREAPTNLKPVG